jgi:hypothetical protein
VDDKLKKKLAYYVAGSAFNYETLSTLDVLAGNGIDLTEDEASEITDIAGQMFDAMMEKAKGWKELAAKQGLLVNSPSEKTRPQRFLSEDAE